MSKKIDLDKLTLRDLSDWAHEHDMHILITLGKPAKIEETAIVEEAKDEPE